MRTVAEQIESISNEFETWWDEHGSGITPLMGDDMESYAKRVAERAWINGARSALKNTE